MILIPSRPFDRTFFVIDGVAYCWSGWFGCQLASFEWTRKPAGSRRHILGFDMTLFSTQREGIFVRHSWSVSTAGNYDERQARIQSLLKTLKDKV